MTDLSSPSFTARPSPSTSTRVPSRTSSTSESGIRSTDSSVKCLPVSRSSSSSLIPPGPARPDATFAFILTRNASEPDERAILRSRRSASTAMVCSERTTPSPPQVGQVRVRISRTPAVTFWRVISTRPSGEISTR